ncbi:MAG: hypothetical protein ABEI99_12635 [Halobaculum sp.]
MPLWRVIRAVVGSSIMGRVASRPRLVVTVALLVCLLAMQGGAVALEGGDLCSDCTVTGQGDDDSSTGP